MQHTQHDEIVLTLKNDGAFYKGFNQPALKQVAVMRLVMAGVARVMSHDRVVVDSFTQANAKAVVEELDDYYGIVRPRAEDVTVRCSTPVDREFARGGPVKAIEFRPGEATLLVDYSNLERRVVTNYLVQAEKSDEILDAIGYCLSNLHIETTNMALRPDLNPNCNQGTNMQSITVTTPTLINGREISTYTDSQVYDLMAEQEAQITKLNAITNKPMRLVTEIAKLQAGIDALVAAMNAKDGFVPVPVPMPASVKATVVDDVRPA